ncbi:MAG: hypothetical protein PHQ23_02520 [Candidatus Wallbacteria bacterium]|nr:hypothetical protein [Candidatus Wallbacteria bacterium]
MKCPAVFLFFLVVISIPGRTGGLTVMKVWRAHDLCRMFHDNPGSAEVSFTGRMTAVRGAVERVCSDPMSDPFVVLAGYPLQPGIVNCLFRINDLPALKSIAPGSSVIVSGVCAGRRVGVVFMERCCLEKKEDSLSLSCENNNDCGKIYLERVEQWVKNFRKAD